MGGTRPLSMTLINAEGERTGRNPSMLPLSGPTDRDLMLLVMLADVAPSSGRKSGGRWADAPRDVYGPKKTLYNRFVRWAAKGV